jgi:hypothetical protein
VEGQRAAGSTQQRAAHSVVQRISDCCQLVCMLQMRAATAMQLAPMLRWCAAVCCSSRAVPPHLPTLMAR